MLDLVFLAMFLVVPIMAWSIYQVRQKRYELHRRVQLILGAVLAVAVVAFEVDMRIHGWRERAKPSPYWVDGGFNDWVDYSLIIHLAFAIPTCVLWIWVIQQAVTRFPRPVGPNEHSARHRRWGWFAAFEMTMTAVTGWAFYYFAFVAS